ncbi:MAG: phage protease [Planctomycetes bacterium]|nr:phage protease [Planctomycetota bacterium]
MSTARTETADDTGRGSAALDAVAQQQILTRLREAVELVEGGTSVADERLREILAEVLDRAEAWTVVRALDEARAVSEVASWLSCAALTRASRDPVTEWLLIPFGEVGVERPVAGGSFVFTRGHAESAKRWFDSLGRKLAVDYEHQSFDRLNARADGLRPAAGWIGGLEVRDDGLWAVDVTWTRRAQELLRSGEYRYFSPVIYWTDEDHSDVAGLGPVALTNDPAMHGVRPLTAARRRAEQAKATSDAEAAGQQSAVDPGTRAELEAAEAEIALLSARLQAQEAEAFVARGLRLGKVLESTRQDWWEDFLRDADMAEERLARAPVVAPPGRMVGVDRRGAVAALASAERDFRAGAEAYRSMGIEVEDLTAYERAAAAGRVRRGGASS